MTHNIQVTVMALALGMTFGVGTLILLFYNGVILGAVAADYIVAGQGCLPGRMAAAARVDRDSGHPAGRPGRAWCWPAP